MSNIELIIEERAAHIGDFLVGRLLPFRQKRAVGPFVFIDHMGPAELTAEQNLDVAPHPHIGLSTLTYLIEGAVMHRDSIGTEIEITPGAINWMTAGKGVVHSERTPDYLRQTTKRLHGLQIWVALPKDFEEIDPSFVQVTKEEIPQWEKEGVNYKLLAGEVFGYKSPVPVYSPLYLIEIKSTKVCKLTLGDELFGESAMYILEGGVKIDGNCFGPKQILVANNSKLCEFEVDANTTVYIFGGEAFPQERFIYWNFVASDKKLIEKAKMRWVNQEFAKVSGETEFVPLPPIKK
ncbi:MAG: pirin family protein [Flavobacteriales bacterium]